MGRATGLQRTRNQYDGTMEWYTAPWLLQRFADFFGGGYFDPCPASGGVIHENGLYTSWRGKQVYCNPPYGKPIKPWIVKACTEPCRELILIVPGYTDSLWFSPLFKYTLCFVHTRVKFYKYGTELVKAPHPTVIVYRGRRYRQFADAFSDLGPILRTYRAKRDAQPTLLEISDGG